jgi:hypothetical protein
MGVSLPLLTYLQVPTEHKEGNYCSEQFSQDDSEAAIHGISWYIMCHHALKL